MILKRLILHNYKQHKDMDITIAGNIIGIIGPNGSGKSNLLGAIHFALAGEQPGFNKSDLLRWGETEGFVELHFTHNGIDGMIRRALHSAHATFKYGEEETSGTKKVEERIVTHLGMDKDLLKQAIFIRQAEIDAILFTDPRIRELSFQRLCGVGEAAKIHKKMGEELAAMAVPPNYDEQIAESQLRYKQMKDRLVGLKYNLESIQSTRAKCPVAAGLQDECTRMERVVSQIDNYHLLFNKLSHADNALRDAQVQLAAFEEPAMSIEAMDKFIADCQNTENKVEAYRKVVAEFERAGKAIIALGNEPAQLPPSVDKLLLDSLEHKAKSARSEYERIESQVKMYQGLVQAMDGKLTAGVECPVCGNKITDTARMITKLNDYRAQAELCKPVVAEREYYNAVDQNDRISRQNANAVSSYKARYSTLVDQYQRAEVALNSAAKADENIDQVRAGRLQCEEQRKQAILSGRMHAQLTTEIKLRTNEHDAYTLDLANIKKMLGDDVTKALETTSIATVRMSYVSKIDGLKNTIQQAQQLDTQIAQLSGMVTELENSINGLENTIAVLEMKRSQQDEYRNALKVLNEVRDWFHYSNGPHTLAQGVLSEMVQDVNLFLDQFSAPFSVISGGDTLGFKCIFHDDTPVPFNGPPDAVHLSGGQRIQLAVAFRFASYCMFASKLGLLSLDEPTVYLDDYHVGRFCALLSKIKEVAQKMNLQVLIATHEQSVKPFMDTIIDFNDDTKMMEKIAHEQKQTRSKSN